MSQQEQTPLTPLEPGEVFVFSCHPKTPCFNQCCQDLNQFITPYDILRLKNFFGISSSEFLEKYTSGHVGPQTGLPVITLKPNSNSGLLCPFVSPQGCTVYPDRPASCRTYPLVRLASRDRSTGEKNERYFLLSEAHCKGFKTGDEWTAEKWVENQGLLPFNEYNDLFMELIGAKSTTTPEPLDLRGQQVFRLACYDLDRFSKRLKEGALTGLKDVDEEVLVKVQAQETLLLRFAMKWAAHTLFKAPLVLDVGK